MSAPTVSLPQPAKDLLDAATHVVLATANDDGSPQTSVVWAAYDGEDLLISTVEGRKKERNLRRTPQVSVLIYDSTSPYSYTEVRGTAEVTRDQGEPGLIEQLSQRYTGGRYTGDDGTDNVRVIVRVTPTHVVAR